MYHLVVDKHSAKPIYLQIIDFLIAEIDGGRLQPGQKIPSANDLSKQMGVSKLTVLQALRELNRMGRVFSSVGKGTYVSHARKLETDLRRVWGFTETFKAQGFKPGSQLISFERIYANALTAAALEVPVGTPIFRIARTRLLNDRPVGVETTHLVVADVPGLDQYDWNTESLYVVLKNKYELEPVCGRNYIEATAADEATARLLSIPKKSPLLVAERISCLANQHPVEFVRSFYRADLMRFKVEMTSDHPMNILAAKMEQVE
jgi:GntR family transcriptional regulator